MFGWYKRHLISSSKADVYDFADLLVTLEHVPILDEKLLPKPKAEILGAFLIYEKHLFASKQLAELEIVQSVRVRLNDFRYIEPTDRFLVDEINSGQGFYGVLSSLPDELPKTPDEEIAHKRFSEMLAKYI